jgi:hypothetical protein
MNALRGMIALFPMLPKTGSSPKSYGYLAATGKIQEIGSPYERRVIYAGQELTQRGIPAYNG